MVRGELIITEPQNVSVPLVSPNKHPIRVDSQVQSGQTLFVKSIKKIRVCRGAGVSYGPDHLDDLYFPLDVQQVEAVVIAHGEDLACVDDPDQLDDSTDKDIG